MVKISCPKCKAKKVYLLSNGKRKCSQCKYEFTPHRLPLHLTREQWREIIRWFLLEQSSQNIAIGPVLREGECYAHSPLFGQLLRKMSQMVSGTVEVDETYLGGQWKNKQKFLRNQGSKRGRGTAKQPVFGILCRDGSVWAEVVDDVSADTLQPLISKKVTIGSIICSDTWKNLSRDGFTRVCSSSRQSW